MVVESRAPDEGAAASRTPWASADRRAPGRGAAGNPAPERTSADSRGADGGFADSYAPAGASASSPTLDEGVADRNAPAGAFADSRAPDCGQRRVSGGIPRTALQRTGERRTGGAQAGAYADSRVHQTVEPRTGTHQTRPRATAHPKKELRTTVHWKERPRTAAHREKWQRTAVFREGGCGRPATASSTLQYRLQSHGFEYTFTLNNLEKAGLLRRHDGSNTYPAVRRTLKLVVEGQDDSNPTDISYTFSGYAPLSIRLIQQALQDRWKSMDELLRSLPGPHFEKIQALDADGTPVEHEGQSVSGDRPDGQRSLVLVVFLGGVTSAETSVLRFLSGQEDSKHDFLVATTKLVTGTSLLETLIDDDWRLRSNR
ncbi:hypothetical protein KFL_003850120 [Klebsormidium nitens]|uniref:Uncharacterized protein n=1 Tax=Klebsormidium nitens TaxID=105231 RepID=A0A1Y1ID69_KLENI|nr:hypothetical protein KFL_003850120 [Klebsormidium nitens]|eukprot:GAQ87892.1 hypothetical protein KFL_003850120 [Klebsormidium nitens]